MRSRVEDVEALALRLVLPPLIVTVATLAQRHLGDRLGGLLVGLPLTSGTFLGLLFASHGPAAVADAAVGMLAGQVAVIALTTAYAHAAGTRAPLALLASVVAWVATVTLVRAIDTLVLGCALFGVATLIAVRTWPGPSAVTERPAAPGARDLFTRITLATALILGLTAGVEILGPQLAGLLSAAPLVALVLAPSTHRVGGVGAVRTLLHGVVRGSAGAAVFATVLAIGIAPLGGLAFLVAALCGISVVAMSVAPRNTHHAGLTHGIPSLHEHPHHHRRSRGRRSHGSDVRGALRRRGHGDPSRRLG